MQREITRIAEQIINAKMPDEVVKQIMGEFFQIMEGNNIYQATESEDGKGAIGNNFEWTMCLALFLDTIKSQLELSILFGSPISVYTASSTNKRLNDSAHDSNWAEQDNKPKH